MPEGLAATLFFAVAAPAAVRELSGRCQGQLAARLGPARLPALEDLHVTLAFLGPTDPARIPDLAGPAAEAARRAPFELRTAGLGGFPRPGRARILWLGFQPGAGLDALGDLAARLGRALRAAQVPFDRKPFQAHLTVARFREPVDLAAAGLPDPEPVPFPVRELTLFQSVPTPHGSRYRPLSTWKLQL